MEANPDEGKALRREEPLLRVLLRDAARRRQDECIGAQGIPLTPWRSLAVDPSIHVYGTPIWIDAEFPITERAAGGHLPASDVRAGYRLRHSRAGARRYLFRPRRGHPAHRRPHQAVRQIRHAGAEGRVGERRATRRRIPLPRPRPKDIVADNAPTPATATAALPKPQSHERARRQPAPRSLVRRARAVDDRHQGDRAAACRRAFRRAADAAITQMPPSAPRAKTRAESRRRAPAKPRRRRRSPRLAAA